MSKELKEFLGAVAITIGMICVYALVALIEMV